MRVTRTNRVRDDVRQSVKRWVCGVVMGALLTGGTQGCGKSPSAPEQSEQPASASQGTSPPPPAPAPAVARAPGGVVAPPKQLQWCDVIESSPDPRVVTNAALREAITKTGLPWRVKDRASGIEMLLVPPGAFLMGMSPGDGSADSDERPTHGVVLTSPFYLGRYEVTQFEFATITGNYPSKFGSTAGRRTVLELMSEGHDKQAAEVMAHQERVKDARGIESPVENLSWEDCARFCSAAGLRLPTEAEWEYACRAGVRAPTYGELSEIAWFRDNSGNRTHTVGTKEPNALGFHDMLGSVWEWVSDWYGPYGASAVTNPVGPDSGSDRVTRGGFWYSDSSGCRASDRGGYGPTYGYGGGIGFRAARTP